MTLSLRQYLLGALITLASAGLVSAQTAPVTPNPSENEEADEYATVAVSDPFERVNRVMFAFNDGLYDYVLRPVTDGYVRVTPKPVRRGITNFFHNIRFPIRFVNSALQFKFKRAGLETGKSPSTLWQGRRLLRVSDKVPALANIPDEDTGQTFGTWRIGKGPYIVLPVFGPSTARDTTGLIGDYFLDPLNWRLRENIEWYGWQAKTGVDVVSGVDSLPGALATYDALRKDALDPYIAVRSAYVQYREAAVKK